MKNFIYASIIVFFCLVDSRSALAQNDFQHAKMDSLAHSLSVAKNAKDSVLLLQQLVDVVPVRQSETMLYPDRTHALLELNARVKLIDPAPYQLIQDENNYWSKKQYAEALKSMHLAVDYFDKQHKSIVPLLMHSRLLYNMLGDDEARIKYYQQKSDYYLVNGPVENAAPCYHSIAWYYFKKGAFNQSISYYLKGAAVFREYDTHYYANSESVIGLMYAFWGNTEKADQVLKYILPIARRANDTSALGATYYGLALSAYQNGRYPEALDYINKEISFQKIVSQRTATIFAFKADVYLRMKKAALALPVLERAKTIADSGRFKTSNNFGAMEVNYNYYNYYLLTGNIKKAEESLLVALKDVADQNDVTLELKYSRELAGFYSNHNQPALSEKYYEQYLKLTDDREKGLNQFKVAQYEIDENDKQQRNNITRLKEEKAVQDYQISRRNSLLWGSAVVLLLITALLVFIYRQLQINRRNMKELKNTQTQLIQSEKMASLGELTAGIAHEIQNPLNFVNNFSEVNEEMIDELKEELKNGNIEEAMALADDIGENEKKIRHHGKRADFIVKGMLQHSRTSTGERQETNINILADEFLKLSYHGLRAKDKNFNAELLTSFDPALPKANIVQQDIGRVLLNLFNNAFYAVNQKQKAAGPDYKPTVEVSTFAPSSGGWGVKVKDNGNGIPDAIKDKIMQPFFTTKPTGEGTGLGLSLAYDIVKAHGGELKVGTNDDGGGAVFIIQISTNKTI